MHERPVAAGRTVGDGDAGPRPPPRGGAGLLPWGRLGRLASPWSTLAPGACLAPVSQEAHMPQALAAVRPDLQEKTPATRLRLRGGESGPERRAPGLAQRTAAWRPPSTPGSRAGRGGACACGGPAPGRLLGAEHRLCAVGRWSGRQARGAADRAPGLHRAEDAWRGGDPAGPVLRQRPPGP